MMKKSICLNALVIIFIIAACVMLSYYAVLYKLFPIIQENVSKEISTNLGDFLWGTIGIGLTFVSTLLMFSTFRMQRKQFEETQKDSYRTRFEGTFFNMLSMFYNVRAESDKSILNSSCLNSSNLRDFYYGFCELYKNKIETDSSFSESMSVLRKSDILPTQFETALVDLGNVYDEYIQKQHCNVGFYFRYVHNLIAFVIRHWEDSYADTHAYLNFIQAQMSDEELALLFYDSISKKGEDKNHGHTFRENLDKYSFLENISDTMLLERCHYKLFPNTIFCFLNNDERKTVFACRK